MGSSLLMAVSPTNFTALTECPLRFSLERSPNRARSRRPLRAAVGSACHRVLEKLVKEGLWSNEDLTDEVDAAWRGEAALIAAEAGLDPARKLPGEAISRVQLQKAARLLARLLKSAGPEAELICEERAVAFGGRLTGRPDLIVRSPSGHWVIDYKSGSARGPQGLPREHYVAQVRLYCVLEHEQAGVWPTRAVVLPLHGRPVEPGVAPADCTAVAEMAMSALDAYNAIAPGDQPAAPAPDHRRWCGRLAECGAVWDATDTTWQEEQVLVAKGRVVQSVETTLGGMTMQIEVDSGSLGQPLAWVEGIDLASHPSARSVRVGSRVVVGRLRANRDEGLYSLPKTGMLGLM